MGIGLLPHTQVLLLLPERSAAQGPQAAGVWGGAACPRGGPGQGERDSETAGGQGGEHGNPPPAGQEGFWAQPCHTSPRELVRSQTCSGSWAG